MKIISVVLIGTLLAQSAFAGLGSKKAQYVGGTWSQLKEGVEGRLDVSGETAAVFIPDKKGAPVEIPYDKITSLEYGQKAGRRVGAAIGWGVTTLGVGALPLLFSKKRKHYLSIGYTDATGDPQGVVLQLGKDVTRGTLMTLQTRSQQEIEYESEEAKENLGN